MEVSRGPVFISTGVVCLGAILLQFCTSFVCEATQTHTFIACCRLCGRFAKYFDVEKWALRLMSHGDDYMCLEE